VFNSLLSFKAKKIEQQISDSQMDIKKAEEEERYEEISELLQKQKELKNISKNINKQLGRIVTR